MPKPNQTMLDRLAETFKSMGNKKPEIIQETTIRDPLGYNMVQRRFGVKTGKMPSMTPERRMYQRGIEARLEPKKIAADDQLWEMSNNREEIEDEWKDAISDAKESMKEDWESTLDYQEFEDIDPYYLEVEAPSTNLLHYWPGSARSPQEIADAYESANDAYYDAKDAQRRIYSTQGIMDEQMMTPRYRNYQRAMRQREENARIGRVNAAIMNLYRRGYSMPEIRAMLNGTIPTPAVGGR